jgi:thiosulfate/3-mercaptopyruvate sulfurtransferase
MVAGRQHRAQSRADDRDPRLKQRAIQASRAVEKPQPGNLAAARDQHALNRGGGAMENKVLLDPKDLAEKIKQGDVVIIDTRDPDSYGAGHIPGAVNAHDIFTYLASSTPEGQKELQTKFAKLFGAAGLSGKELAVVYEQSMNTGFGQSCRGYYLLKFLGYPKAAVLHGGFKAWLAAGLPTSTEPATPTPKSFPVDPAAAAIMVDANTMLKAVDDPGIVKLDVRDVDEWIGTSSSPYGVDFCPRKGRIPGARWLEWYRMMKPSKDGPVFKNKDEIKAECQTIGVTVETPVILYCFKGARTSTTFLALKEAGVRDVRVYFGSWNEWSRDPSLPIEEGFPDRGEFEPMARQAAAE